MTEDSDPHPDRRRLLICGVLGTLGALLILIADIVYNLFGGDQLGTGTLHHHLLRDIPRSLSGGQGSGCSIAGLRPAGPLWSLYPCLLFAFLVSTVNVSGHAAYPFWAAIDEARQSPHEAVILAVRQLEAQIAHYTGRLSLIQTILEVLLSVWIAIPILRGRTLFPRWLALLIPIFPTMARAPHRCRAAGLSRDGSSRISRVGAWSSPSALATGLQIRGHTGACFEP